MHVKSAISFINALETPNFHCTDQIWRQFSLDSEFKTIQSISLDIVFIRKYL